MDESSAVVPSSEAHSDGELIDQARSGDTDAFAELWRRHSIAGRAVARSITSSLDADDLVAESYAKIFQAIRSGGGPSRGFRPYLFTTIRNTAAAWGRGRRETPIDDMDTVEDPDSSEDATLEALDRSLTARAFRSLPTRWQEVLWYSEVESMTPQQIAPLLDMKANSVAALAYRAREGLRQAWIQAHLATAPDDSDCRWTIERLGAYSRHSLSKRDTQRLEGHLGECAKCTIVAAEAKDVSSRLALVLLPLAAGVTGATGYLAWLQSGGHAATYALGAGGLAMPASVAGGGVGVSSSAGAGASGSTTGGAAGGTGGAAGGGSVAGGAATTSGAAAGGSLAATGAAASVTAIVAASVAAGVVVVSAVAAGLIWGPELFSPPQTTSAADAGSGAGTQPDDSGSVQGSEAEPPASTPPALPPSEPPAPSEPPQAPEQPATQAPEQAQAVPAAEPSQPAGDPTSPSEPPEEPPPSDPPVAPLLSTDNPALTRDAAYTVRGTGTPGNTLEATTAPAETEPAVRTLSAQPATTSAASDGTTSGTSMTSPTSPTTATVNDDGTWSVTVNLAEGANVVSVVQTDASGRSSDPATLTVTLDSIAPQPPTVTATDDSDGRFMPILSGAAEPYAIVTIFHEGTVVASTTASSDGAWSIDSSTGFVPESAEITLMVRQTDAAGNISEPSEESAVTITLKTPHFLGSAFVWQNSEAAHVVGVMYGQPHATVKIDLRGDNGSSSSKQVTLDDLPVQFSLGELPVGTESGHVSVRYMEQAEDDDPTDDRQQYRYGAPVTESFSRLLLSQTPPTSEPAP